MARTTRARAAGVRLAGGAGERGGRCERRAKEEGHDFGRRPGRHAGEWKHAKGQAERDLEDTGDKIKAGAKAVGAKMEDPDRDLGTQYEKKKAEEKAS